MALSGVDAPEVTPMRIFPAGIQSLVSLGNEMPPSFKRGKGVRFNYILGVQKIERDRHSPIETLQGEVSHLHTHSQMFRRGG
jgi:hypothetical protein